MILMEEVPYNHTKNTETVGIILRKNQKVLQKMLKENIWKEVKEILGKKII